MHRRLLTAAVAAATFAGTAIMAVVAATNSSAATDNSQCRPDGLYPTAVANVPYCDVYDTNGREKMGADHQRRIIGYFTSWRTGKDGTPSFLVPNIPWNDVTHINYAFAHVDGSNHISVGNPSAANNPATNMTWPGVAGADMDPAYSYTGHFNLLNKFKKQHPNVKTLISVGGWAETGGFIDDNGVRQDSGGFYRMTTNSDNSVNTAGINAFADSVVTFLRTYGFDGVDIDYEYPTSMTNSGNPLDFTQSNARRAGLNKSYPVLMKTLREKLDAAAAADGKYYLLSVAAPASGYMLRGMENFTSTQYLDYINVMTYDLHGAWNAFVGPNAALYDNGDDAELQFWNVYTTAQYGGIGYLNTDWAYHYFRGAVQAGRINLGVPYYTRGWRDVTGGTNGLWGSAPLPDQAQCPDGTGGKVNSKTPCGNGAIGIDNLWHDKNSAGNEEASGSNPMWHAKNLEHGIQGDYLTAYGLDPVNDPDDKLTGTYTREYSSALVAPWLWNAQKKVFLSTEDEQSIGAKADYVVDHGIGGLMIWELAGDYKFDSAKGEYVMGSTLTDLMYDKFKSASPYGNLRSNLAMPTQTLDIQTSLYGYALGDNNYPINPKLKITNNSSMTIPGGAKIGFDYGVSAPENMSQQSGWSLAITRNDHTGANRGGFKGDFHHVEITVPSYQTIAPGASVEVAIVYQMPFAGPSNWTISFNGQTYGFTQNYARGTTTTTTSPSASVSPTVTTSTSPSASTSPSQPPTDTCTAAPWDPTRVYTGGEVVSYNGHQYTARWWTQGNQPEPGSAWGVWKDNGPCSGGPSSSPSTSPSHSPSASPSASPSHSPSASPSHSPSPSPSASPSASPTTGQYPAWQPNHAYSTGDLVSYNGKNYRCVQPHTSLPGWEPSNVPALWTQV